MPRVARNSPVIKSNTIDTRDVQGAPEQVATMAATGPAEIKHSEIIPVDKAPTTDKLEMLKFMEELVTVEVSPTGEQDAPQFTQVWNGGRSMVFPHGHAVTCARKFVEVLARSKMRMYKNEEYEENGVKNVRWPMSPARRHQFAVLEDTAKGREWLRNILKEAA